ncbi:DUF4337 domain-containing protein [Ramlibacter sp. G-1-2-2]|uniref:DUF4337 domain-containing protein n=1 Tax=Ramlibacter agri TaxID=2728837 RepID=A0A848GZ94_9BURK|nr:DUF4337 domain-containing protein [Ramlibacter agri]NML43644.1 DUF4337 domain-containing protein [Ramlibacter agri]
MENPVPETPQEGGSRLNTWVALSVAILSTVMGVSKVKDDNIVQAMQQAQADKNDHWAFYQARNLREEVAHAQVVQLQLQIADKPPAQRAPYEAALAEYQKIEADQAKKKEELRQQAAQDQKNYDALNFRDDQFDLADAGIAIAIAALAVASVTQTWWLFWLALVPGVFGTIMGIAGLAGWRLHPDWLTTLLS